MNSQPVNTQPAPANDGGSNSVAMVLLFIVVIIVVAAGAYFLMGNRNATPAPTDNDMEINVPDEIDVNIPNGDNDNSGDEGGTQPNE